jgi:hypothetical protein
MAEQLPPDDKAIRDRQRSGARVTAWVLTAFILLVFLITIAKMMVNQ